MNDTEPLGVDDDGDDDAEEGKKAMNAPIEDIDKKEYIGKRYING